MNSPVRPARKAGFLWLVLLLLPTLLAAQTNEYQSPDALKALTLEELMNQEVTIVGRRQEKLSTAPSAVQVITSEDIHRSGATTIPEALRLASNLQVAQVDSRQWAIDARGFNNTLANKLLVMIDGRVVYTPLFAGVFWDMQNTLLDDIDRIEVVSGPGATLWGANAVNGVINIVTKSARDTQGVLVEGAGGTFLQDFGAFRYGGSVGTNLFFRLYGQRLDRNPTTFANGVDATNAWAMTQGGLRMDWYAGNGDLVTLQGDAYSGGSADRIAPDRTIVDGQNVLARWTREWSAESALSVQTYFDRTWRRAPQFAEDLRTYDLDFQARFPIGGWNSITVGGGYRLMQDNVQNGLAFAFVPSQRDMQLFSGFIQDEIALAEHWKLILGTKVENNDFSGIEVSPSARLAWTPNERNTVWAAVSRAVRSPSRVDSDLFFPSAPPFTIAGGTNFVAEKLVALEMGYRVRPLERVSLSLAAFYNFYDDIRSLEPITTNSFEIENQNRAESWGFELSGNVQAADWWRLRGGYTFLHTHIVPKGGGLDLNRGRAEGNDPQNQFLIQSMMDLPARFQLDITARYVDTLPSPNVPSYFTFDARLAWHWKRNLELSVVGQNLWDHRHPEFGAAPTRQEIPRSVYGKMTWQF